MELEKLERSIIYLPFNPRLMKASFAALLPKVMSYHSFITEKKRENYVT